MKRLFLFLSVVLLNLSVWASAWTPETLPVPANTTDSLKVSYVSNPDGILSPTEVDRINAMFFKMEKNQGVRGLVVVIKEMDPDDPYEFTMQVANKHGIGGKANTGVVVMLATESRGYSILTGDGMEKFLTDAQCGQIERNDMVPLLKEGKWGEGVIAACEKISGVVSGEAELVPDEDEEDDSNIMWWVGGSILGLVGVGAIVSRKSRECPKCKKGNFKMILRQTVLDPSEPDSPTEEEAKQELQAKLLAMKIQKNRVDAEKVRAIKARFGVADSTATDSLVADSTTADSTAADTAASIVNTAPESMMIDGVEVTPAVAAAALAIADAKKAFDTEKKEVSNKNGMGAYRNVRMYDIYQCPDCGFQQCRKGSSTTQSYRVGLFTAGAFGAIMAASGGSGGGLSGGGGASYRRGGFGGGSSHSWGSSGGGHFSGGGASGRF